MRREIEVKVSEEEIRRFVESLPPGGNGKVGKTWTAEEDAKLMAAWPVCNHDAVAKALHVSPATALKRYRDLSKGANED